MFIPMIKNARIQQIEIYLLLRLCMSATEEIQDWLIKFNKQ